MTVSRQYQLPLKKYHDDRILNLISNALLNTGLFRTYFIIGDGKNIKTEEPALYYFLENCLRAADAVDFRGSKVAKMYSELLSSEKHNLDDAVNEEFFKKIESKTYLPGYYTQAVVGEKQLRYFGLMYQIILGIEPKILNENELAKINAIISTNDYLIKQLPFFPSYAERRAKQEHVYQQAPIIEQPISSIIQKLHDSQIESDQVKPQLKKLQKQLVEQEHIKQYDTEAQKMTQQRLQQMLAQFQLKEQLQKDYDGLRDAYDQAMLLAEELKAKNQALSQNLKDKDQELAAQTSGVVIAQELQKQTRQKQLLEQQLNSLIGESESLLEQQNIQLQEAAKKIDQLSKQLKELEISQQQLEQALIDAQSKADQEKKPLVDEIKQLKLQQEELQQQVQQNIVRAGVQDRNLIEKLQLNNRHLQEELEQASQRLILAKKTDVQLKEQNNELTEYLKLKEEAAANQIAEIQNQLRERNEIVANQEEELEALRSRLESQIMQKNSVSMSSFEETEEDRLLSLSGMARNDSLRSQTPLTDSEKQKLGSSNFDGLAKKISLGTQTSFKPTQKIRKIVNEPYRNESSDTLLPETYQRQIDTKKPAITARGMQSKSDKLVANTGCNFPTINSVMQALFKEAVNFDQDTQQDQNRIRRLVAEHRENFIQSSDKVIGDNEKSREEYKFLESLCRSSKPDNKQDKEKYVQQIERDFRRKYPEKTEDNDDIKNIAAWYFCMHTIGAEHCADIHEAGRQDSIIDNLLTENEWTEVFADKKAGPGISGLNLDVKFKNNNGDKKLVLGKEQGISQELIDYTIDQLGYSDGICWDNVPEEDKRRTENRCLSRWKKVYFDGEMVKLSLSHFRPAEKGDWSGWVQSIRNSEELIPEVKVRLMDQLLNEVVLNDPIDKAVLEGFCFGVANIELDSTYQECWDKFKQKVNVFLTEENKALAEAVNKGWPRFFNENKALEALKPAPQARFNGVAHNTDMLMKQELLQTKVLKVK